MKRIFIISTLAVLFVVSSLFATVINIPADYPTIQQGIDASADGDTVLVQPGTYVENINFNGHNIVLGSLFLTTGDTSYIEQTVIDGDSSGSVVTFESGEDSTTILTGFIIGNGKAPKGGGIHCVNSQPMIRFNNVSGNIAKGLPQGNGYGGGIYCENNQNIVIINNKIGENIAVTTWDGQYILGLGGGICCFNSLNPLIAYNDIYDNSAWRGAGIYCDSSDVFITCNNISDNDALQMNGGGICFINSSAIISGCYIYGNLAYHGGGIYSLNSNNIIICDNIISENFVGATGDGGGICCRSSINTITNNIIINNTAGSGGGIYCDLESYVIINNNDISENTAYIEGYGGYGGGIEIDGGNIIVSKNRISHNYAYYDGGGIACRFDGNALIINNRIVDNIADYRGGGVMSWQTDPTIYNNIVNGNLASDFGGGMYCYESDAVISNCVFLNNTAVYGNEIYSQSGSPSITYSNIQGGWPGTGNIDVDPLFRDPVNNDFHLMSIACGDSADSPCIDAGDPAILDSLLDCSWGLGGARSDMGAFGGGDSVSIGILDNIPLLPDRFILLQNYPNPFNAQTTIRFMLQESQHAKLTVFDLLGRRVETLLDEYMQAGVHAVTFDASHLSSGVYFYRLQAREMVESKRMVLLK
jgi:hypothetical protein